MNYQVGLNLRDIRIFLEDRLLISISDFVGPGEVLTVMGPSGSGKSTLLSYIGGFLHTAFKANGEIILNGKDISDKPAEQRRVGILFQDSLLFPHMSVGENLLFALPADLKGAGPRKQKALEALNVAGLGETFDRDPATLSGGQKARVALMRVLLANPQALLLDEPFSKLDTDRRDDIRKFVFGEAKRRDLPVLLITHDVADADAASGKIFSL